MDSGGREENWLWGCEKLWDFVENASSEEKCGGGGLGPAGRDERREGPGSQDDGGRAERERAESGLGALGEGEESRKKGLSIRERSRNVAV